MGTPHYASTGYLATIFQVDVGKIEVALEALGIKPAYRQNGISFYEISTLTPSTMNSALGHGVTE